MVGPGGLMINPPPILPIRKTTEIDRPISPNDAGLQSVVSLRSSVTKTVQVELRVELTVDESGVTGMRGMPVRTSVRTAGMGGIKPWTGGRPCRS